MADECDVSNVSKIVTKFLLNTCRLPPRMSKHDIEAVGYCVRMASVAIGYPEEEKGAKYIPLLTGSVAEFYIEPMLPHVGDIDIMKHRSSWLGIPLGHAPPTHLPPVFHRYVNVVEIINSHFPGYVYLHSRYLLTQCLDDDRYQCVECDEGWFFWNRCYTENDERSRHVHGPALFRDHSHFGKLSVDDVRCVRCLSWPLQASDWPTRRRNYSWPDSATVDRVVSNGCDLVGVAHRRCRQYKWIGEHQWRLSFSRAEIVLINSWMAVQQITYHILRVYVKSQRMTESADNNEPAIMSNYNIKTLMLWACELKPNSWWIENLNLVRICVELLNTLSVWLTDTRCPHYFINNCNLLDNSLKVGSVASKLRAIDEGYLSTWLLNNYIRQCVKLCPVHISQLFDDVSAGSKLQKAVSETIRWRQNTSLWDMWNAVGFAEIYIAERVSVLGLPLTAHSSTCWLNELTKIDEHFSIYFAAVALLHVACRISGNGFSDTLTDILSTLFGHNFSQYCSALSLCETELNTSELVVFLQKSAVEHLTTYRQLRVRDFDSIATIVTTDFEAMYAYKRGDYQRCLQLSIQNTLILLYAIDITDVPTSPEFIQLLEDQDDFVSLTALTLIVNPECRNLPSGFGITQWTLSLYLMTQCQLKLHHSAKSLAETLHSIKVAQRRHTHIHTLDKLTLKLIERKVERLLQ